MKHLIFLGLILLGQYSLAGVAYGGGALIAPTPPVLADCTEQYTTDEGTPSTRQNVQCMQNNNAKIQAYNELNRQYSFALQKQNEEKQKAESEEQRRLAAVQAASTKAAAEAADSKNQEGSKTYGIASLACAAVAGAAVALMPSCTGPQAAVCLAPLIATAAAFTAFAMMGAEQANSHDNVASLACNTAGQVSSAGSSCPAPPGVYNPQTYPTTQATGAAGLFNPDGRCIGRASDCARVVDVVTGAGADLKNGLAGLQGMANGSINKGFTIDKNGNIVTNDGKKFKPTDFLSEKSMVAAGISAADASAAMGALNKSGLGSGIDAKAALAKENSNNTDGTLVDLNGGSGGAGKGGLGANGSADKDKDLNKRKPANADGLVVNINGDLYGVAGDDIFKMMNRRYKLKTAQDNFIAP